MMTKYRVPIIRTVTQYGVAEVDVDSPSGTTSVIHAAERGKGEFTLHHEELEDVIWDRGSGIRIEKLS